MLAIRLINFKGVSERIYSLPSKGTVLFSGPNGSGKSTLLEAISFALYDGLGNSCYPWQGKSNQVTSVHLVFPNGLNIYRQRRPALFRVVNPSLNIDLVGDPATAYIESIFGPEIGWLASGYIKQLTVCRFLTMTAAEKLEFLQQMFLPDPEKCENLLRKTNQLLSFSNERLQQVSNQRQVKEQVYLLMYNQMPPEAKSLTPWTFEQRQEFLSKWNQPFNELVLLLNNQIIEIRRQITQGEAIVSNNHKLSLQVADLQKQLLSLPNVDLDLSRRELSSLQSQLTLAQGMARKNQLLISKSHLENELSKIPSLGVATKTLSELAKIEQVWIGPSCQDLKVQVKKIQMALKYQKDLVQVQKYQELTKAIDAINLQSWDPNELVQLEKELLELNHQAEIYQRQKQTISRYDTLVKRIANIQEELKKSTVESPPEGMEKVNQEIKKWEKQLEMNRQYQDQQAQIEKIKAQLASLPESFDPNELTRLEKDIILGQGKSMICPCCQAKLKLQDGILIPCDHDIPNLDDLYRQKNQLLVKQRQYQERLILDQKLADLSLSKISFDPQAETHYQDSLKTQQTLIFNQKVYQHRQTLTAELNSLEKNRDDIQDLVRPSQDPTPRIQIVKARLTELTQLQSLAKLRDSLLEQRKQLPCPELGEPNELVTRTDLSTMLLQTENILQNREMVPWVDVEQERKILAREMERQQLSGQIQKIDSDLQQIVMDPVVDIPEVKVLQDRISELQKEIEASEEVLKLRTRLEASLNSLSKEIVPEPDLTTLKSNLSQKEAHLQECQVACHTLHYQDLLFQLQILYQEHAQLKAEETVYQDRISRLIKIRTTILMAEYVILDSVLARINGYLERLLETIFPDPIRVKLRSLRKLKTQDRIKPEINIEIEYRGSTLSNPNDLSGGQYMRISVALVLAFALMGRYPFVFLDEAMTALDVTSRESIVETLNQLFTDKLVCVVAHDTTEGVYSSALKF